MLRLRLLLLLSVLGLALSACGTLNQGDPAAFRATVEGLRPAIFQ